MDPAAYLTAGIVAICTGLDRTAALQVMLCRPLVAGPLTGWLLGDPQSGLLVGLLLELLWLGRLPVGAAIPPDDTQVAVGATTLALTMGPHLGQGGPGFVILCLLVAMPLGKISQFFERLARNWNGRLAPKVEGAVEAGRLRGVENLHLWGLGHFGLASLATFAFIVAGGSAILVFVAPPLQHLFANAAGPLRVVLPLVGVAAILGTINVQRVLTLFGASFASALLMLWLL
jgi:PTS system mannose-specific IIC component